MLRFSTGMFLILTLFLPASLMPFGEHSIDGQTVTFVEFWEQGGGPIFAGIGTIACILSYGFIRARPWARPFSILCFLCAVSHTIWDEQGMDTESLIMTIFSSIIWPAYLYLNTGVRRYFSQAPQQGERNPISMRARR